MKWTEITLGELGTTYTGLSGKTKENFGAGKPYITYMNIFSNSRINPSIVGYVVIRKDEKQNRVKFGDVFFTTSSETIKEVGMTSVLLDEIGEAYLNSFCFGFRLNDFEILLPVFAQYLFRSEKVRHSISLKGQGSTRYNLSKTELLNDLVLQIPSKSEQTKIASVLITADAAIEQTEKLIAKYQRIKTGLMQDLLTKGIDANGNIRSNAAHKFVVKNGIEVPEEWEVVRFEDCYQSAIRDFGSFSSTKQIEFIEQGIPFLKSEMIGVNKIKWENVSFVSKKVHELLNKSFVRKGNLLFSKIGSALGKAVVYEDEQECNSNAAIAKIDLNPRKANNHFICYFLNFDFAQAQFKNMIVSLLPRINLGDINDLVITLPKISEQEKITEIIKSIDENIDNEIVKLSKLNSLKTGLMQDLLSGEVRVNVKKNVMA